MNEIVHACLEGLQRGEFAAALMLADHCQDCDHPRAERISQMAQVIQGSGSFLEVIGTKLLFAAVVVGSDEEANDAVAAFERLVRHDS